MSSMKFMLVSYCYFFTYFIFKTTATGIEYRTGQQLDLWANKIGPYSSPTESYGFFDRVPWCQPQKIERRALKLGETLAGDLFVKSDYSLAFRIPTENQLLCEKSLTKEQVQIFVNAIKRRFVYDLLLDGLPIKLFVGELTDDGNDSRTYLYTRLDFKVSVNQGHIIEVIASPGNPVELKEGTTAKLQFTYSVSWQETSFPFARRAEKYKDPLHDLDKEIHWFSIGNAILSVLLLMGLLGSILVRVVRKDFREHEALEADEGSEEYGWKLLHGDVFRFPSKLTLLCPLLGTGVQLLTLSGILLLFGALEFFHPLSRGAIYTTGVVCYAFTAGIAGFSSGYLYKQMGGSRWVRNALATVFVFGGPLAIIWSYLNTVAVVYNSTRALPLWTIVSIMFLWALVTIPLTILGAIVGKNQSRPYDTPGRTTKIPREIPDCVWYRRPGFLALCCGLMPFCSIYVEMSFLFGALWGHKIFQVYEMLGIVFFILIVVTTITTASAIYFQLAVENYKWTWASLGYGGSVGAYMLVYSIYYYYIRSPLEGFMQASFFFGYMSLVCYSFFLMCGTVGFFSARRFVMFLYSSLKND